MELISLHKFSPSRHHLLQLSA